MTKDVVLSIIPDSWEYSETLSVRTNLFKSIKGVEHRHSVAFTPKIRTKYTINRANSKYSNYLYDINKFSVYENTVWQPIWGYMSVPLEESDSQTVLVRNASAFASHKFLCKIDKDSEDTPIIYEVKSCELQMPEYDIGFITLNESGTFHRGQHFLVPIIRVNSEFSNSYENTSSQQIRITTTPLQKNLIKTIPDEDPALG